MMSISERKTKLKFQTASAVWERGENRPVVIEAHAAFCLVRLKGMRKSYIITYAQVFNKAVKMEVEAERREKREKKKAKAK